MKMSVAVIWWTKCMNVLFMIMNSALWHSSLWIINTICFWICNCKTTFKNIFCSTLTWLMQTCLHGGTVCATPERKLPVFQDDFHEKFSFIFLHDVPYKVLYDVPFVYIALVQSLNLEFTCMPSENYRKWFRPLLLWSWDLFWALINSLYYFYFFIFLFFTYSCTWSDQGLDQP